VVLAFTAIAFAVGMSWWYRAGFVAFSGLFVVAFVELAVEHVTQSPGGRLAIAWQGVTPSDPTPSSQGNVSLPGPRGSAR
jgi:hypothetical protein